MGDKKIILCRPTFGEGHNKNVIEAITEVISKSNGIILLTVNSTECQNRTEYEFIGPPDEVIEAALAAARVAYEMIDASQNLDPKTHVHDDSLGLCLFSPVRSASLQDCVDIANRFARKLSDSLNVPTFLRPRWERSPPPLCLVCEWFRHLLGTFEPDHGPSSMSKWGITWVSATDLLLDFRVFLISSDEQASRIAGDIRQLAKDNGSREYEFLQFVRSLKSCLDDTDHPSISVRFIRNEGKLHIAYEELCKRASELKLPVIGSKLIGALPLEAILDSADYFIEKESLFVLEDTDKVQLAVSRLGLSNFTEFKAKNRIIEYALEAYSSKEAKLIDSPVKEFISSVGDRTPLPAGGSVSALVAALGCALASMVGRMSSGRKTCEDNDIKVRPLIQIFHKAMKHVSKYVDDDVDAYRKYISARRMTKSTLEEQKLREEALDVFSKQTVQVPLDMAQYLETLLTAANSLAQLIIFSNLADLEVGVNCILLGVRSSLCNIKTNAETLKDATFKETVLEQIRQIAASSEKKCTLILDTIEKRRMLHSRPVSQISLVETTSETVMQLLSEVVAAVDSLAENQESSVNCS